MRDRVGPKIQFGLFQSVKIHDDGCVIAIKNVLLSLTCCDMIMPRYIEGNTIFHRLNRLCMQLSCCFFFLGHLIERTDAVILRRFKKLSLKR